VSDASLTHTLMMENMKLANSIQRDWRGMGRDAMVQG
jgi:hypothetical protein